MPHFTARNLSLPSFPCKKEGYTFHSIAQGDRQALISVSTEDRRFYLALKERADFTLVSFDKLTRISPVGYIKKALELFAELSQADIIHSNLTNISMRQTQPSDLLKEPGFFLNLDSSQEHWVEVGFGSGRHLLYQAERNPDIQFIGVEIHKPSIEQVLRRIELANLKNIYIAAFDARLLCEILPSNRTGRIFVHFPVPWDDRPLRRIISCSFIEESTRILKPGGTLELRTDSDRYFRYSLDTFLKMNRICLKVIKNRDIAITSKYEDRWRRMEKDIHDVIMTNETDSPEKLFDFDFSFDSISFESIQEKFQDTTITEKDFLLHIERIFAVDVNHGTLRITMGDFAKPEHKYIVIDNETLSYFPSRPLPTAANIKAHQTLNGWLRE